MAEVQKLGRDIKLYVDVERYDIVDGGSAEGAVGKSLDILKARLSVVASGQHVEYTVRVQYEGNSWTLRKRFNEVAALNEFLKKRLSSVPELPAKSVVRQFSTEYLEARRAGLKAYLQELIKHRDAVNCQEVQQFFGLTQQCPKHFGQPHASEPVQAAEVHEAAFGIADFAYDQAQGLLLLGATDASWTSRMDTKITNIKLPWEPSAPNLPTSQMSLWAQSPGSLRFEMQFTSRYTATISCVCLAMSRDKGLCLCGLSDGSVGCHPVRGATGVNNIMQTLPLLRHTAAVRSIAFDDAEQWVITASKDNALMVYDIKRQMIGCEVQTPVPVVIMRYCQVQKRLFTGLQNGRTLVWDVSVLPIRQLGSIPDGNNDKDLPPRISAADYDPVTSTLFTAAKDGFTLWAVKSSNLGSWGRKVGSVADVAHAPTAVAWATSSHEIIAGFATGTVIVFDVDKGEASYAFQAHKDEISTIQWLDAPRRLLTASKDKTLKVWDFPSLRKTSLEETAGWLVADPPTVSMAPGTAPRSTESSRGSAPGGRGSTSRDGGDPLLGNSGSRSAGSTADVSQEARPRPSASFDPLDPLGRGQSSSVPHSQAPRVSTAAPASTASRNTLASGLRGGGSRATTETRPSVAAGPAAGTTKTGDSDDDDLAGWAN